MLVDGRIEMQALAADERALEQVSIAVDSREQVDALRRRYR